MAINDKGVVSSENGERYGIKILRSKLKKLTKKPIIINKIIGFLKILEKFEIEMVRSWHRRIKGNRMPKIKRL